MASGTATRGTEVDTLLNIEDLRGTQFADTLQGNNSVNVLDGNAGNDTLNGRGGDDLLAGSTGSNTLDGGAGTDRVTYSGSSTAISLDLGTDTVTRGTETDRIFNIENATGSPSADTMRGDTANNLLQGLGGNDSAAGPGRERHDRRRSRQGQHDRWYRARRVRFRRGRKRVRCECRHHQRVRRAGPAAGDTIDLRDVFGGHAGRFAAPARSQASIKCTWSNEGTATIVEINLSGTTAPEMEIVSRTGLRQRPRGPPRISCSQEKPAERGSAPSWRPSC